jgi:L,D-transpeptidase ErfK/SrfK
LGERWLGFKEDSQYGIHGTNSESTIGSYESGGCLRLHNADVIELFELVKSGIAVSIAG